MSYGFRTPQEKALATFNPSIMDNIQINSGRTFESEENQVGKFFNYHMDDRKKEFASTSGIYLSPYSFRSHSHPLCKTIENYFLYVVIPPLIGNFKNLNVVSMKESKLKILHDESKPKSKMSINLINRLIDVKDSFRYSSEDNLSVKYPSLLLGSNCKDYDPLIDVRIPKESNFLFHDELHYWTFEMMLDFLEKFEPSHVICTAVFPIEILEGVKQSLFPDVYAFEILKNGNFLFAPDGVYSEAYEQSVNMRWLFCASSFTVNGQLYSVDLIKTVGAHHLFIIVKGKRVVKSTRIFRNFDILDMSQFLGTRYKIPIFDVHFSFFKKIVIYLKSLKKPDSQSAVAKLRQLVGESISLTELLFVEDFATRFAENGSSSLSCKGVFDQLCHTLKGFLPLILRRLMTSFESDNILNQISKAKPFEVVIGTMNVDRNYDNSCVWRLMNSMLYSDQDPLECDKILFRELKKGEDKDLTDRRRIVHQFTPPMFAFPNGDNLEFRRIKLSNRIEKLDQMKKFTIVSYGSKRDYSKLDELCISSFRRRLSAALLDGQIVPRDRFTFETFFERIGKGAPYRPYKLICGDESEEKRRETMNSMLNTLYGMISSNIELCYGVIDKMGNEPEIKCKLEEELEEVTSGFKPIQVGESLDSTSDSSSSLQIEEINEEDLEAKVLVEKTSPNEMEGETSGNTSSVFSEIEIASSDLSEFMEDIDGIKPDKNWDELVTSIEGKSFLHFKDEFEAFLKGVESMRIRSRKAYYFCKNALFTYGHDRVKYKNLGWPAIIGDLCKVAQDVSGFEFNSVLVNDYNRLGKLTWHADDEDVYDLDKNPVLTLNLLGDGMFSVRKKSGDEHSFLMKPGSVILMKEGAQKKMKHSVVAKNRRVSLTFRQQIRSSDPIESEVKFLTEKSFENLKECCLIDAMSKEIKMPREKFSNLLIKEDQSFYSKIIEDKGLTLDDLSKISNLLNLSVRVLIDGQWNYFGSKDSNFRVISLKLEKRHFSVYDKNVLKLSLGDEDTKRLSNRSDKGLFSTFLNKVDPGNKFVNKFSRSLDFERASTLIGSFLRGTTGIITSSTFGDGVACFSGRKKNIDPDYLRDPKYLKEMVGGDVSFSGAVIMGFAGCGKSRPVQMALETLDSPLSVLLISPRTNLLADWKQKVRNDKVAFRTFEAALKENFSKFSLIIIDEFLLAPRGFTDVVAFKSKIDNLTCMKKNNISKILLIGDPLQSTYYCSSDNDLLPLTDDLKTLEIDYPRYLLYSYRLPKQMSNLIDIKMFGNSEIEHSQRIYNSASAAFSERAFDIILVAGQAEKTFFSNFKVMTFGESQGLTFDKVCIALSEDTLLASDNHIMVGLTRAKKSLSFIKCFGYPLQDYLKRAGGKIIGKVLAGIKIKRGEIENMLGMEDVSFIDIPITFGGHEERVAGDPWMKGMLSLVPEPDIDEPIVDDVEPKDPKMKVHINITDKSYALTIINDQIRSRESREFRSRDAWSSQFKDDDHNLNLETSTGPVNFEAIFPRHKSFDDVTFWMAVKKRLSFSNPLVESEKLKKAWIKGSVLHKEFTKLIKPSPYFRPDLFEKALLDFEDVRMRKSEKLITAHAGRSDPDWDIRNFLLFMKSQLCKKDEKKFCDAKAGQTIACFAHGVLFKFSAWARYAELKIAEKMPEAFYVHSKKNFDDLEKWVKKNFIGPTCVESDYEAFDASQDAAILAFECLILKDVGWPNDLIEDYKTLKLELGCKLGNLAIMRFTGEFGTFFFNTLANMAFTFCRYHVNRRTPICFAGDDMCILADAKVRHDLDGFIDTLKLKAKVEWKINPIFCGWILSRRGILKLPSLVYYRLCIAKEKGNLKDCIDSYMIEAGYAYRKGAFIEELLNEDQLNFHQLVIRSMVKSKHLMKGSSVAILEDIVDNLSDGI